MPRYFDKECETGKDDKGLVEVPKLRTKQLKKDKNYTSITKTSQSEKMQKKKKRKRATSGSEEETQTSPQLRDNRDPFPGKAHVPLDKVMKYKRGKKVSLVGIKTKFKKTQIKRQDKKVADAVTQAARAELLLMEESGYIETEEGEETAKLTQQQLAASVDITSATKYFDLRLVQFGPYKVDYSRNGRHLLIGGRKGHVAAMDWVTKRLHCEINVMEEIQDIRWLHQETMFAVAQKDWVHIYDNQGVELHCIKRLHHILRMEFLPYHFLLATSNEMGFLSWLDTSMGVLVTQFPTKMGRLDVMCHNPYNGVVVLGHPQGTVSMWSPNTKEPLLKMLCHHHSVRAVSVDPTGTYMASAGVDRSLKIWDLRNTYRCLQSFKLRSGASHVSYSQRGQLATSIGNVVEIYEDCHRLNVQKPFLHHSGHDSVASIKYCPYEDVLGIGHRGGFTSILVPGAGEPNFDALESNPFQTKSQRKEAEVKALLEKVQPEMIALDPRKLCEVNKPSLQEKLEEKKKLLFVKPPRIDFEPRHRKKGKDSSKKKLLRKKGVKEEAKKKFVQDLLQSKTIKQKANRKRTVKDSSDVLDRFKTIKTK